MSAVGLSGREESDATHHMHEKKSLLATGSPQKGVNRAIEMKSAMSRWLLTMLLLGVFIIGLATAVESNVTYAMLPFVTSAFQAHSMMSTVQIVSNSCRTLAYAISAKVADVFGRLEAFTLALVCTVAGYLCMGFSANVYLYCLSQALYVGGVTGISISLTLLIADHSSLVNRVLMSCIPNIPYLVSGWIGPRVAEAVLEGPGWRFGIVMWSFILPIAACILFVALIVTWQKARSIGTVKEVEKEPQSIWLTLWQWCVELDLIGLVLFAVGLLLFLVPWTLNTKSEGVYFGKARFLCPMIFGLVVLVLFVFYDTRYAKFPLVTVRMLHNPTVRAGCLSGFFYFMAFYIFDLYSTSYFQVAKFASVSTANYINNIFSFVSTGAGILSGLIVIFRAHRKELRARKELSHRRHSASSASSSSSSSSVSSASSRSSHEASTFAHSQRSSISVSLRNAERPVTAPDDMRARKALKLVLRCGMVIYLIGIILFCVFIHEDLSLAWLIVAMVVISLGAGLFTTPLQSACQAVLTPSELGSVTALILTLCLLGGSVGSAISGAVWTHYLFALMRTYLPEEYKDLAGQISEDMSVALSYPADTPVRAAINRAYRDTIFRLSCVAVGLAVLVVLCTFMMRPDKHIPPQEQVVKEDAAEEEQNDAAEAVVQV